MSVAKKSGKTVAKKPVARKTGAKKQVAKKPIAKKSDAKKPIAKKQEKKAVANASSNGKKKISKPASVATKPKKIAEKAAAKGKPISKKATAGGKTKVAPTTKGKNTAMDKVKKEPTAKKESKHWFPKDAKPAVQEKAPAKKSPWQRKMVPINYGTIGGPVTSIKDLFHKYIDDNHRKMSAEERQSLWQVVGLRMLSNGREKLSEIIDQEIKNSSGTK